MKAVNKVEIEENNENNEKESSQNQWKMFADDSLPTFFRRMTFSPDGTLLFLPSGIFRSKSKDSENTTEVLNTVYIFSRNNFSRYFLFTIFFFFFFVFYHFLYPKKKKKNFSKTNCTSSRIKKTNINCKMLSTSF